MLVIAAGVASVLAILMFVVGLVGSQRGEKAPYYAARREAHRTATRIYSWSLWCLGLAVALFVASWVLPSENLPATQTQPTAATPQVTASLSVPTPASAITPTLPAIDSTPSPFPSVTVAPTVLPSAPTPTSEIATSATTPEIVLLVTPTAPPTVAAPSVANAPPTAQPVVITVMASDKPLVLRSVSNNATDVGTLVGNTAEFGSGVATVYVLFDYHDIPRGTVLRHTWLRNGTSVSFSSAPFSKSGQGTDNVSWTPKGGFSPGVYEVRVALANTLQFTANFLVK